MSLEAQLGAAAAAPLGVRARMRCSECQSPTDALPLSVCVRFFFVVQHLPLLLLTPPHLGARAQNSGSSTLASLLLLLLAVL